MNNFSYNEQFMFKLGTSNSHEKINFVENFYHVRHPISGIIPILSRFFFPEFFPGFNGKNFQVTHVFVKKTGRYVKGLCFISQKLKTESKISF